MKVLRYSDSFHNEVAILWNQCAPYNGYAMLSMEQLDHLLLKHPCFSEQFTFVLVNEHMVCGFICGCEGINLPKGKDRGYLTCLLLDENENTKENTDLLLEALECAFKQAGKQSVVCNFFNPMRLPWIIPDTNGCQHNNAPGIAVDSPLYDRMLLNGYNETTRECAMYLDLKHFTIAKEVIEKEQQAAKNGYHIDWYHDKIHTNLDQMVDSLGNPMWSEEIPVAARQINMLVALKENVVVGFSGPVYPEATKRGYFAGIAVAKEHEKQGLGLVLFNRLCQEEKAAGAEYMSLFTGIDNHAQKIYLQAGFEVKRVFAVMSKEI